MSFFTPNKRNARRILWIESIGFIFLVALSWVDELLGLPGRLFGGAWQMNWRESALESIAIGLVWLVVYGVTRKIVRRFRYLEDLLTMCAWCRKLEYEGDWLSLEDYCVKELGIDLSHGLCPKCGRQLLGEPSAPEPVR
ncbi:MAG: hypothetical protein ABI992_10220 [Chthoniobacterales bacterium]